jgi:predicted nucleic acid-binding protein
VARFLLDSDAVIEQLQGKQAAVGLIRDLFDRGETLCTCDVVIAEVYSGLPPTVPSDADSLLRRLIFLRTSRTAAQRAGYWRVQYARTGLQLATTDVLIAATAAEHRATVVTGNTRHFPMPEVSLLPLPR